MNARADEGFSRNWLNSSRSDETFVDLPQELPVRLNYENVFVDDGQVVSRTDPYGWSTCVAEGLGFDKHSAMRLKAEPIDVAP